MSILSQGELTKDVESALSLKNGINPDTPDGRLLNLIILGVEAWVQEETNRNWESTVHRDEPYDIATGQRCIFLTDRPVTSFGSLKKVTARSKTTGLVTSSETIDRDLFVVDMAAGIIESLNGAFSPGAQAYLSTFTAGYSATEISGSTKKEIKILKHLMLAVIQREYKIRKESLGHMNSISFGEESASLQFNLTPFERRLLDKLRR